MKATLLVRNRTVYADDAFAEVVVWQVPQPLAGSAHGYKYRLALVVRGECVLRYDNETGKGDHRHAVSAQSKYRFGSLDKLFADFELDIESILNEDSHP